MTIVVVFVVVANLVVVAKALFGIAVEFVINRFRDALQKYFACLMNIENIVNNNNNYRIARFDSCRRCVRSTSAFR